jgi:hypothetical protein
MAAAAFNKVLDSEDVWGKHRVSYWDMVLSATVYAAGGIAVTAAQFGLRSILSIDECGASVLPSTTSDYKLTYNSGTGKVQLFGGAASGVALAEGTGTLTLTKRLRVMSTDD